MWRFVPQRIVLTVDRFLELGLVQARPVVHWLLRSAGVLSTDDEHRTGATFEVLGVVLTKTIGALQVSSKGLSLAE